MGQGVSFLVSLLCSGGFSGGHPTLWLWWVGEGHTSLTMVLPHTPTCKKP